MTGNELRESRKVMGMTINDVTARLGKRLRKLVPTRTYQGWEGRADRAVPIDVSEAMTREIADYQAGAAAVRAVLEN